MTDIPIAPSLQSADVILRASAEVLDRVARDEPVGSTLTRVCEFLEAELASARVVIFATNAARGQLSIAAGPSLAHDQWPTFDGATSTEVTARFSSDGWALPTELCDANHALRGLLVVAGNAEEPGADGRWLIERFADLASRVLVRFDHQQSLLEMVSRERDRIAGEIHDDPIQAMTAVSLRLQLLRGRIDDTEQLEVLGDAQQVTDDAIDRLRTMLFRLHPPTLDSDGLVITLDVFLESAAEPFGIDWTVTGDEERRAAMATEALAFRLAREAIANAVKHAGPSRITVDVALSEEALVVTIADDGSGFTDTDAERARAEGHLGLVHSETLAASAGGTYDVESSAGSGTTVRVTLPNLTEQ